MRTWLSHVRDGTHAGGSRSKITACWGSGPIFRRGTARNCLRRDDPGANRRGRENTAGARRAVQMAWSCWGCRATEQRHAASGQHVENGRADTRDMLHYTALPPRQVPIPVLPDMPRTAHACSSLPRCCFLRLFAHDCARATPRVLNLAHIASKSAAAGPDRRCGG